MTNWLSNFLVCDLIYPDTRIWPFSSSQVVQVLPTMTASIDSYTFLLFAIANVSLTFSASTLPCVNVGDDFLAHHLDLLPRDCRTVSRNDR